MKDYSLQQGMDYYNTFAPVSWFEIYKVQEEKYVTTTSSVC